MSTPPRALLRLRQTPNDEPSSSFGAQDMSISSVFNPDALIDQSCAPDRVILSSDRMLFYVHSKILLHVSRNAFSGLLLASPRNEVGGEIPVIRVESDSTVLNLILHAVYGRDMAACNPSLAQLSFAVESLLVRYSVPSYFVLWPGHPLFETILAHAVMRPLPVYILAAHYELEPLAVAASTHMLSFPLAQLTDDDARAMGAVYLRRLFCLQLGRVETLRGLLLAPPGDHAPSAQCDEIGQQPKVQRAWALAVASIVVEARADTSSDALEAALRPLLTHVRCNECRRMLSECTEKLVTEWSAVKKTI